MATAPTTGVSDRADLSIDRSDAATSRHVTAVDRWLAAAGAAHHRRRPRPARAVGRPPRRGRARPRRGGPARRRSPGARRPGSQRRPVFRRGLHGRPHPHSRLAQRGDPRAVAQQRRESVALGTSLGAPRARQRRHGGAPQRSPSLRPRQRLLLALARRRHGLHLRVLRRRGHEPGRGADERSWISSAASCSCAPARASSRRDAAGARWRCTWRGTTACTCQAFNLSGEQLHWARARARREGLDGRVEFIEDDYRNVAGHVRRVRVGRHARARRPAIVRRARRGPSPHRQAGRRARPAALHRPRRAAAAERVDPPPHLSRRLRADPCGGDPRHSRAGGHVGRRRREPASALRAHARALERTVRRREGTRPRGVGRRVLPHLGAVSRRLRSGIPDRMDAAVPGGLRAARVARRRSSRARRSTAASGCQADTSSPA